MLYLLSFLIISLCFLVDLSIGGVWSGRIEEQCEKMAEHHTPLSKQQFAQLIRSLILVEQVSVLPLSHGKNNKLRQDCYHPKHNFKTLCCIKS